MRCLPQVVGVLAAALLMAAQKGSGNAPSDQDAAIDDRAIEKSVRGLGDPSYQVREASTRWLIEAGKQTIPAVTKAACVKDQEVSIRALFILGMLYESANAETSRAAHAALQTVAAASNQAASFRAKHTLKSKESRFEAVRKRRNERTKAALKQLGVRPKLDSNGNAISVDLSRNGSMGAVLKHLEGLTTLTTLDLRDTQIGDAELVHVKGLTGLETLNLRHTRVSDAGLVHLKGLRRLKWLCLEFTSVTDAGLVHVLGFSELNNLYLGGSRVAGPGLAQLKKLPQLTYLSLQHLKVGDEAARYLAELSRLETLGLDDTLVTDAGLAHLEKLTHLKVLWLTNCKVTDSGLKHVKKLTNLTRLEIKGTQVTDQGVADLLRALPNMKINR